LPSSNSPFTTSTTIARILEGTSPSDLRVEQPTRYELVVNLRAADEYKIVLPREFLLRADRVIR